MNALMRGEGLSSQEPKAISWYDPAQPDMNALMTESWRINQASTVYRVAMALPVTGHDFGTPWQQEGLLLRKLVCCQRRRGTLAICGGTEVFARLLASVRALPGASTFHLLRRRCRACSTHRRHTCRAHRRVIISAPAFSRRQHWAWMRQG